MLRIEKASVAYGQVTALREVSLTVNDGEIVTLIGANGAGKSTLLNAISGVVPLKSGGIWLGEGQPDYGQLLALRQQPAEHSRVCWLVPASSVRTV